MSSILPEGSDSKTSPPSESTCPDCGTPSREHWNSCRYYSARRTPDIPLDDPDRALGAALLDEVMFGDHSNDSANAVVAQALKQRALIERQRTLADARAMIERETSAYPDASPSITSGIWGGFDQWAVSEYGTLADPDRRLCGQCGQRHTQYEYDDAHRNDEGGY